jgi:hypothetical protein
MRSAWANTSQGPISKTTRATWTGGMAQVVGCLLCIYGHICVALIFEDKTVLKVFEIHFCLQCLA